MKLPIKGSFSLSTKSSSCPERTTEPCQSKEMGMDESDILGELQDGSSQVIIVVEQGVTEAELLAQTITVQTAAINQALADPPNFNFKRICYSASDQQNTDKRCN